MRVPKDHIGFKGDECQCGRRMSLRHCIKCGSTRVYARSNRKHTMMNGELKLVENQFRCQTCGHLFIEEEREWCVAPPVGEALSKLKVQQLATAVATEDIPESVQQLLPNREEVTPQKAFRTLVFQHRQMYRLLKDESKLEPSTMTEREFLEKWIKDEGIAIPEGESLYGVNTN